MKTLLTITAILLGLTAQSQKRDTLLNVTGSFAKDSVPLNFTHLSGKIVNGYEKLIAPNTEFSGLTFNQSQWAIKSKPPYHTFEVNGDKKEPIMFKINDTEYLIYNKKIYRLLN